MLFRSQLDQEAPGATPGLGNHVAQKPSSPSFSKAECATSAIHPGCHLLRCPGHAPKGPAGRLSPGATPGPTTTWSFLQKTVQESPSWPVAPLLLWPMIFPAVFSPPPTLAPPAWCLIHSAGQGATGAQIRRDFLRLWEPRGGGVISGWRSGKPSPGRAAQAEGSGAETGKSRGLSAV